jgi:hypothetical protein
MMIALQQLVVLKLQQAGFVIGSRSSADALDGRAAGS